MAFTAVALAVTTIGTGASIRNQRRAAQSQRRAERLSQRQADLENQRRIRQAVAQARVDRANTLAAAAASGAEESSAVEGGISSQNTQLSSNIGFAQQTADANRQSNRLIARSNAQLNRASTFQAVANLPTQFGFNVSAAVRNARRNRGTTGNTSSAGTT